VISLVVGDRRRDSREGEARGTSKARAGRAQAKASSAAQPVPSRSSTGSAADDKFAAIVAKTPMRSGGDYSVGRFARIEAECANRIPLCLTQEVGHAELSLTKGVQHGIHRNSLL